MLYHQVIKIDHHLSFNITKWYHHLKYPQVTPCRKEYEVAVGWSGKSGMNKFQGVLRYAYANFYFF